MDTSSSPQSAVILADFVGSRSIPDFRKLRDEILAKVSGLHRSVGAVAGDYAVTAWDEFQNLVPSIRMFPRVVWDLRCSFYPARLSIAIGVGRIESLPEKGEPINLAGSGEAFERARAAMEKIKDSQGPASKYKLYTAFKSDLGGWGRDSWINLTYRLLDSMLLKITRRQWETILAYQETGKIEKTAVLLEIDESTVSRNLRRGFYWQIQDALAGLESLVDQRVEFTDLRR